MGCAFARHFGVAIEYLLLLDVVVGWIIQAVSEQNHLFSINVSFIPV